MADAWAEEKAQLLAKLDLEIKTKSQLDTRLKTLSAMLLDVNNKNKKLEAAVANKDQPNVVKLTDESNSAAVNENKDLKEKLSALRLQKFQIESKHKTAQEELEKLRALIDEKKNNNKDMFLEYRATISQLQQSLGTAEAQLVQADKKLTETQLQVATAHQRNTELQQQFQGQIVQLEADLERSKIQNAELEQKLSAAITNVDNQSFKLNSQLAAKVKEDSELRSKFSEELKSQTEVNAQAIVGLQASHAKALDELQTEIKTLRAEKSEILSARDAGTTETAMALATQRELNLKMAGQLADTRSQLRDACMERDSCFSGMREMAVAKVTAEAAREAAEKQLSTAGPLASVADAKLASLRLELEAAAADKRLLVEQLSREKEQLRILQQKLDDVCRTPNPHSTPTPSAQFLPPASAVSSESTPELLTPRERGIYSLDTDAQLAEAKRQREEDNGVDGKLEALAYAKLKAEAELASLGLKHMDISGKFLALKSEHAQAVAELHGLREQWAKQPTAKHDSSEASNNNPLAEGILSAFKVGTLTYAQLQARLGEHVAELAELRAARAALSTKCELLQSDVARAKQEKEEQVGVERALRERLRLLAQQHEALSEMHRSREQGNQSQGLQVRQLQDKIASLERELRTTRQNPGQTPSEPGFVVFPTPNSLSVQAPANILEFDFEEISPRKPTQVAIATARTSGAAGDVFSQIQKAAEAEITIFAEAKALEGPAGSEKPLRTERSSSALVTGPLAMGGSASGVGSPLRARDRELEAASPGAVVRNDRPGEAEAELKVKVLELRGKVDELQGQLTEELARKAVARGIFVDSLKVVTEERDSLYRLLLDAKTHTGACAKELDLAHLSLRAHAQLASLGPWLGFICEPSPLVEAGRVNKPSFAVRINKVLSDTASQAGLRPGSYVEAVGGLPTPGLCELLYACLVSARPGQLLAIKARAPEEKKAKTRKMRVLAREAPTLDAETLEALTRVAGGQAYEEDEELLLHVARALEEHASDERPADLLFAPRPELERDERPTPKKGSKKSSNKKSAKGQAMTPRSGNSSARSSPSLSGVRFGVLSPDKLALSSALSPRSLSPRKAAKAFSAAKTVSNSLSPGVEAKKLKKKSRAGSGVAVDKTEVGPGREQVNVESNATLEVALQGSPGGVRGAWTGQLAPEMGLGLAKANDFLKRLDSSLTKSVGLGLKLASPDRQDFVARAEQARNSAREAVSAHAGRREEADARFENEVKALREISERKKEQLRRQASDAQLNAFAITQGLPVVPSSSTNVVHSKQLGDYTPSRVHAGANSLPPPDPLLTPAATSANPSTAGNGSLLDAAMVLPRLAAGSEDGQVQGGREPKARPAPPEHAASVVGSTQAGEFLGVAKKEGGISGPPDLSEQIVEMSESSAGPLATREEGAERKLALQRQLEALHSIASPGLEIVAVSESGGRDDAKGDKAIYASDTGRSGKDSAAEAVAAQAGPAQRRGSDASGKNEARKKRDTNTNFLGLACHSMQLKRPSFSSNRPPRSGHVSPNPHSPGISPRPSFASHSAGAEKKNMKTPIKGSPLPRSPLRQSFSSSLTSANALALGPNEIPFALKGSSNLHNRHGFTPDPDLQRTDMGAPLSPRAGFIRSAPHQEVLSFTDEWVNQLRGSAR